jgi:hypothetical protein
VRCTDDTRVFIEPAQGLQIEMIEMRMRQKDNVDLRQLVESERGARLNVSDQ